MSVGDAVECVHQIYGYALHAAYIGQWLARWRERMRDKKQPHSSSGRDREHRRS